jgi:serine/threonine-protein kinase
MTDPLKTRDLTLSPEMAQRVDAACDRFEAAWRENRPLTIEEVVGDTPEPERSALLRHLILLDVDYRRRAGEAPRAEDYQQWYSLLGLGWFAREFEGAAASPVLRYRLADELDHGGMGSVLRGYDPHMGRELAVKVLLEKHRGHPQLVQRFLEEARIGARLQHPGIVPVYDRGEFPDQRPFFTMKLVQGRTLAALLKERTQPDQDQARFLGIFEQIAQTMAYAHANGIIHRDLKPANVMVGAFGEVQVMDWGLAKVLAAEQRAGAESQGTSLGAAPAAEPDMAPKLDTERGLAMGTYQYMPPEQARGEIDRIDERSDVFGLGAILCEILTGRPPFTGKTREELSARAMACDHAEAFAALDHSGADVNLVQLTKRCLAADGQERPRNAGEVASAMTTYLTSVAERKRAAELAAAKATARAASERKARHLTIGLAAATLLLVVGGGGAAWQWQVQRAEQRNQLALMRNEVVSHLEQTEGWMRQENWPAAQVSLQRAQDRLANAKEEDMRERIASLRNQLLIVNEFERVRLSSAESIGETTLIGQIRVSNGALGADYRKLFHKHFGLNVETEEIDVIVQRLEGLLITKQIAAALENWGIETKDVRDAEMRKLLEIAQKLDPDDSRGAFRAAILAKDWERIRKLAATIRLADQQTSTILLLSQALQIADLTVALRLLEEAQSLHPDDFWINHRLAGILSDDVPDRLVEAVGYYRVAVGLRPRSSWAMSNLGRALLKQEKTAEAEKTFQTAIRLDPSNSHAHDGLALLRFHQGKLEEAEASVREAIRVEPTNSFAHNGYGYLLYKTKKYKEGVAECEEAIRLHPKLASAHNNLGLNLEALGEKEKAESAYKAATLLDSRFSEAFSNLGALLRDQNRFEESRKAYDAAIAANPNNAIAHHNLAKWYESQKMDGQAEKAYKEAIRLNSKFAEAHNNLGNLYKRQGKLQEAGDCYASAIEAKPDHAKARFNLGLVWESLNNPKEAASCFRSALKYDPLLADAHEALAVVLIRDFGRPREAEEHFRAALKVNPKDVASLTGLSGVLILQGKALEAMACSRQAVELSESEAERCKLRFNYAMALREHGEFKDSLEQLREAKKIGTNNAQLRNSLPNQMKLAEMLVDLEKKFPTIINDEEELSDQREMLMVMHLARWKQRFRLSALLFEKALKGTDPRASQGANYIPACAACLAADGKGFFSQPVMRGAYDPVNQTERARLRQLALIWLRADLAYWTRQASSNNPAAKKEAGLMLEICQMDVRLESVRDKERAEKLSKQEQEDWRKFWDDVDKVLKKLREEDK